MRHYFFGAKVLVIGIYCLISTQSLYAKNSFRPPVLQPTISSFSPASGYTGTTITITGANFTGATSVTISGTNVISFVVNNDNSITAVVSTTVNGPVSVTSPGGTGLSSSDFIYYGYITANNGDWSAGSTWLGGSVPPVWMAATIKNTVSISSSFTNLVALEVSSTGTLKLSKDFTNNGSLTIKGTLECNTGATFIGTPPIYTSGSNLNYVIDVFYDVRGEWTSKASIPGLGVPAKVTITRGIITMPIGDRGIAGDLITPSGNFRLNPVAGDLFITGDFDARPSGLFTPNNRGVIFNGTTDQRILTNGNLRRFDYLTVDKSGGNLIAENGIDVTATLKMLNGNIDVKMSRVHIQADYIRTNGYVIGKAGYNTYPGKNTYGFPIGTASGYSPAELTFESITEEAAVFVGTYEGQGTSYPSDCSNTRYLNRYWLVTSTLTPPFNATASFTFAPGDVVGGAPLSYLRPYKYDGIYQFPATGNYSISGITFVYRNITSFSEFGAGAMASTLPVTLLSFNASVLTDNKSRLVWQTGSELNFSHFTVEKSRDAVHFIPFGNIAAKGDNNSYSVEDILTDGITYYRLRMIDIDQNFKFSRVVAVNASIKINRLSVFPNPAQNSLTVVHPKASGQAFLEISGLDGVRLMKRTVLKDALQSTIDLSVLTAGNYFITYYNGEAKESIMFVKR